MEGAIDVESLRLPIIWNSHRSLQEALISANPDQLTDRDIIS